MTKKLYLIDTDTHKVVPRAVTEKMYEAAGCLNCSIKTYQNMTAAAPEYPAVDVVDNDDFDDIAHCAISHVGSFRSMDEYDKMKEKIETIRAALTQAMQGTRHE
jgi:hypothetical protein